MKYKILLQAKFILVAFVNFTYGLFPPIFRRYYLRVYGMKLGKSSTIHRKAVFFHIGNLEIGKNSIVNFGCYLDNRRGIFIGNNVGIAHNTKIYTLGHDLNDPEFKTKGAAVRIEDNAFIFSNCLIMPGVTIKEGAVVLAGSVVTKDVEAYTIVGGNPVKKIRDRSKEISYIKNYSYLFAL
ncbi:MAG: acyltransferase [Pseudopedobacter saltans]|uniref:Acyltransferase n=1 Tax=Pseudopedobacter saltans TaxID=151895 RepID=A0A2W5EKP5_9SPHI|nr:MAG: acyltransferase [Pseudopedobacter saltans]